MGSRYPQKHRVGESKHQLEKCLQPKLRNPFRLFVRISQHPEKIIQKLTLLEN